MPGPRTTPETTAALLRRLRLQSGRSQAELAVAAATSQSAVARYETGVVTPSLDTLHRLLLALGHRLRLEAVAVPDDDHLALAHDLLDMSPTERLGTLRGWAALAATAGRAA